MTDLDKSLEHLSLDENLSLRHKKERKELQAKVQALKKTAGKGDKKKKKEVLEEIARLESDLEKRHADELAKAETTTVNGVDHSNQEDDNQNQIDSNEADGKMNRVSRAQKRRDKKANEEKNRQAEILAQEEINKTGPRVIELNTIKNILAKRNLLLHPIASDGNCLYNAIRNQLRVTGRFADDVQTMRHKTANYISENKDSLIFYMTNPDTGDCLTDAEFEKYCADLKNTAVWGGQIEISALSQILQVPIEVIQATGPSTIQGDDKFKGPNLIITYHRNMYSLGEHYNGTRPKNSTTDNDDGDDNEE
ncbi:deubiquitinase OTUD6B [Sitodiplosis mosellana]|uniref:deubiquitinase OTUD6B n=1 Tax=Sitodiplosis mosellana TaxID=263140 RepID=UPI002444860B|nr:deubiquitinase OTUD6B [Sitodiplosis mosellana]